MKVYLAGPMRGIKDLNFPLFHKVAKELREKGFEVFNPAENDEKWLAEGKEFTIRDCLEVDLSWICKNAEGIVMLPGWDKSPGATAERSAALALNLKIFYYPLSDFSSIYNRQIEFSSDVFGPGLREKACLDHIREELVEVEKESDLEEKAKELTDVLILTLDYFWRLGYDAEDVLSFWENKLSINEKRQWPDWRTIKEGEVVNHVRG